MGWPIETADFEELTFEYTPEELGIDSKNAAKIQEIKRLRPLAAGQPWGIFFVKFEPKKLPVVALRRILGQVALKKRASANKSERQAWSADDLLFVSNYGEGDQRQISFAHFASSQDASDLPTLKVLGWDNLDTALHLDEVAKELSEHLAWPEDAGDANAWRRQWRSAFTLRHREIIETSRDLSVRLAELARGIRDRIKTALAIETDRGALTKLLKAFQESLVHDLDAEGFADMYSQTIAYGLLSARIANPSKKTADDFAGHMRTNPFLRELMETFFRVGGRRGKSGGPGIDFDELGVSEVVHLLDAANMEAVVRDFGDRNPQEDPVIHFYELFLKEYDPRKRMERGVFYTPRPIVSFIVRSVDEVLRSDLGLQDGLADTSTWGEMLQSGRVRELPAGIPADEAFVQILDPATGTGTFLVEAIDVIHSTMVAKWRAAGRNPNQIEALWNSYVPRSLLPRLHGFELLMAPYAIAHLKVGLKLHESGYDFQSDERARVFLTNALEPSQESEGQFSFMVPALAHEAAAVNTVKKHQRFTVVIGNPPYSISSWNSGEWITELVEDYKRTVRGQETQIQALSNDYIKFLRLGQWQVERSGIGVMGLITGHGYLQGTQPRDLRKSLSQAFGRCYCVDLHGSVRRAAAQAGDDDEPVFQIMTGVAIVVGCRARDVGASPSTVGQTALTSLVGPLASKFSALQSATVSSLKGLGSWHTPSAPNFYFAPALTSETVSAEYATYTDLPECFGTGNRGRDKEVYWATGFATQQDDLAISFSREELEEKMVALGGSKSFEALQEFYRLCTTNQWSYAEARRFANRGEWREHVGVVAYRPFDRRFSVLHKHVMTIQRKRVMDQLGGSDKRIGLVSSRAVNDVLFAHSFVVDGPVDKIFISSKTSTNAYVFPLWVTDEDMYGSRLRANFSRSFVAGLGRAVASQRTDSSTGMPEGVSPEDAMNYLYGVLHSPIYRARYGEMLKIDFPRIPMPRGMPLFRAIAELGGRLVAAHLLRGPKDLVGGPEFVGRIGAEVERIAYSDGTVWIDKSKAVGFRGVPAGVWEFQVGGYQACDKWLKDRKGRKLSKSDVGHYQRIVVALADSIACMAEVDAAIERHGGWPGAFGAPISERAEAMPVLLAAEKGN